MDTGLRQIIELIPTLLTGVIPSIIVYLSLRNREKKNKADAQEIINKQFLEVTQENKKLVDMFERTEAARQADKANFESERVKLTRQIKENSDKLADVEAALIKTKDLLDRVSSERDGAKRELDDTNVKLTNTRKLLEDRIAEVQGLFNQVKGDYDLMAKQYDDAKAERAQIEKAFADRVSKLEQDLLTAETALKDVSDKLQRVEALLTRTQEERDGLQRKNEQLEAEQANLKKRVSELETERDGLQRQVDELRTELNTLRSSGQVPPDNTDLPTNSELPLGSE